MPSTVSVAVRACAAGDPACCRVGAGLRCSSGISSPSRVCGAGVWGHSPRPAGRSGADEPSATGFGGFREGAGRGRSAEGATTPTSPRSAAHAGPDGSRPAAYGTDPSGVTSDAHPPSRPASTRSTAPTGSGRDAAVARARCASLTRRSSSSRARAMSSHTARATPENVVRGGTSSSGSPCRSHAATSADGTSSYTGATPKPSAAAPAATTRDT